MAGFETVNRSVEEECRIAVVLGDAVPGEFFFAEVVIVLGKIHDEMAGKTREVVRGHHLVRIGPAGGIGEGRIGEAEFLAATGHGSGEFRFGTVEGFGNRDAGVIAGLDDDALNEDLDGDRGAELRKHGGGA